MAVTKFLARDLTIHINALGTAVGGNVTGDATTNVISTATNHGLVVGQTIRFITLTGGDGLAIATTYFVLTVPSATTFTLAATLGGAVIDFTTAITAGTIGGYPVIVNGLNSLTHSPSSSDADTTSFDSEGRSEHMKAERGDSWTLAGFYLEDVATGDRDPGQAAVEALAQLIGPSSLGVFKITSPGGNTITFSASAEVTLHGGGNNDAAAWQATIVVSGAVTYG